MYLPSSDQARPIPISSDQARSTSSDQARPTSSDRSSQASIVPISIDLSLCCLSVWVCLCVGVFVYICVFFFLSKCIFVLICLCGRVCVWMCLCAFEEKEEDEKLLSLLSPKKEREKKE